MRAIDLSGERFGRLVALAAERMTDGKRGWRCRCECDREVVVLTANLRRGNSESCGCSRDADDFTGRRFGRLVVLERVPSIDERGARWRCRCDCGFEKCVRGSELRLGNTRSCGCLTIEAIRRRCVTHGRTQTSEYSIWRGIRARCRNPACGNYRRYGARGIDVCERWYTSFETFLADMGERPSERHSIDRIDNDGNYEPGNCRWATREQQARNRADNRRVAAHGETHAVVEWAEITGVNRGTLIRRLNKGMPPHLAVEPVDYRHRAAR